MARCLRCNAGNEWIEGNVAKSVPLDEMDERIADLTTRKVLLPLLVELERQLAKKQAEIEAMRPMIEACKTRHDYHLIFNRDGDAFTCRCTTCQWYRDYLKRKQP